MIDARLERRYSAVYQRLAAQQGMTSGAAVADGFWLSDNGRHSATEAGADAFATWLLLYHAPQPRRPVFPGTPIDTDYATLAMTAQAALVRACEWPER